MNVTIKKFRQNFNKKTICDRINTKIFMKFPKCDPHEDVNLMFLSRLILVKIEVAQISTYYAPIDAEFYADFKNA